MRKVFFTLSDADVCLEKNVSLDFFHRVLKKFQQIEPLGLGAHDVRESLLIQLEALSKETSLIYHLVQHHFNDLIRSRIRYLAKKFHLSTTKLKSMIQEHLRLLCPFPGHQFLQTHNSTVVPDLYIEKENEVWEIRTSDENLPSFHIHSFYLNCLEKKTLPEGEMDFIRRHLASGKWLLRILERRKKTLKDIGLYILKKQEPFLEGTAPNPFPMTMREVARALEVNESTVTRAVSNKYISCPRGLLKLRDFFTQGIQTEQGKISNQRAKDLLLKLVKNENKRRPLSDQALSEKLIRQGIPCARRTVAKYRKELKIGTAALRRKD